MFLINYCSFTRLSCGFQFLLLKMVINVAHLHFPSSQKLKQQAQLNSQTIYGAARHFYMRVKLKAHNYISFFIQHTTRQMVWRGKTLSTFFHHPQAHPLAI